MFEGASKQTSTAPPPRFEILGSATALALSDQIFQKYLLSVIWKRRNTLRGMFIWMCTFSFDWNHFTISLFRILIKQTTINRKTTGYARKTVIYLQQFLKFLSFFLTNLLLVCFSSNLSTNNYTCMYMYLSNFFSPIMLILILILLDSTFLFLCPTVTPKSEGRKKRDGLVSIKLKES